MIITICQTPPPAISEPSTAKTDCQSFSDVSHAMTWLQKNKVMPPCPPVINYRWP